MIAKHETLRIGISQDSGAQPSSVFANLQRISKAAERARQKSIDVLVFPECFLTGYFQNIDIKLIAKSVNESVFEKLVEISREYRLAIVVGTYEFSNNKIYNSAVFITPQKGFIGCYRKRALYGGWEQDTFDRGDGPLVLEYLGWKIGLLICFDVEFPELTRELANRGADIVIVPTSLMEPYDAVAKCLVPTRALENQMYLVYANRVGMEQEFAYIGQSSICGPDGMLLAAAGKEDIKIFAADLHLSCITKVRQEFSYLAEFRKIGVE